MESRREPNRNIVEERHEVPSRVEVYEQPGSRLDRNADHLAGRLPGEPRVRWGGVTSGFVTALGLLLLLVVLGLAIGFTAIGDPRTGVPSSDLGTGAGIWGALILLFAYFFGGMVSTRVTDRPDRGGAVIHGLLVWTLTSIFMIWLLAQGISFGVSNVFGALGGLTRTAATAAVTAATTGGGDTLANTLGFNNSAQLLARLDDPQTARLFATATGTSPERAQAALAQLRSRLEPVRNNPEQMLTEVRNFLAPYSEQVKQQALNTAAAAQQGAKVGSWVTFGMFVLTLLASILGALAGVPNLQRWQARRVYVGVA
jgi:hypothetical protein